MAVYSILYQKSKQTAKGVFSSPFYIKNFGFWSIILQNGTKHHAKFLGKNIHSPFWILASRDKKKPKSPHPPHEKFSILDGTKHTNKNFDILHFIIPK
jgi:hypothetical protein